MSHSNNFNKDNIEIYLKYFAEEYKNITDGKQPLKIILIGGASVLFNYNFRKSTNDIDYSNPRTDFIDYAVEKTANKFGLFDNWLNNEFRKTESYSDKINDISIFYKKILDIVEIWTVSSDYLIAMKLRSLRDNKHDYSDIAGILMESKENNNPLKKQDVENAIINLYGDINVLSEKAKKMLNDIFKNNDFKNDYLYYKRKEEAVRNQYKKLKKENIRTDVLDHKILLNKAINLVNNKFEEYDIVNNNKETILQENEKKI